MIGTAPWLVWEWLVLMYASVCRHGLGDGLATGYQGLVSLHGRPIIGMSSCVPVFAGAVPEDVVVFAMAYQCSVMLLGLLVIRTSSWVPVSGAVVEAVNCYGAPVIGIAEWLACDWQVLMRACVGRHSVGGWVYHGAPVIGAAPWLVREWLVRMHASVCRHAAWGWFSHGMPVIGIAPRPARDWHVLKRMPASVGKVLEDDLAMGYQ